MKSPGMSFKSMPNWHVWEKRAKHCASSENTASVSQRHTNVSKRTHTLAAPAGSDSLEDNVEAVSRALPHIERRRKHEQRCLDPNSNLSRPFVSIAHSAATFILAGMSSVAGLGHNTLPSIDVGFRGVRDLSRVQHPTALAPLQCCTERCAASSKSPAPCSRCIHHPREQPPTTLFRRFASTPPRSHPPAAT